MNDTIGFAGLGDIGSAIAARLQENIGPIWVWNRTAAKAAPLVELGAGLAESPKALAARCSLIVLCLTSDAAVEQVAFGSDRTPGLCGHGKDLVIVNLSTGFPDRSRDFAARAAAAGAQWLDAPVSGGVPAARKGTLTLFLGGEERTVERAEPLLSAISRHRTRMGSAGAGQVTKLCNQMIVATNMLAIAEAVATGRKAGIDVSRLAEALAGGFADSAPLQVFGPRMASHTFEPRLGALSLMLKDVEAARGLAAAVGTPSPVSDFVATLYRPASDQSGPSPDEDLAALIKLFEAG